MTTMRWEFFLLEGPRRGTYDLGIAYERPRNQKTETAKTKIGLDQWLHKQYLGKIIERDLQGTFATEDWNDSLVIKGARVRKITKIVRRTRYSGALHDVPYKLYFDSHKDADRLAFVVGFASRIREENGRFCFMMPASIRDDSDDWEKFLTRANGGEAPRREAQQREAPRREAPQREAPQREAPQRQAPQRQAPQRQAPRRA